jgi:hypothetical protein
MKRNERNKRSPSKRHSEMETIDKKLISLFAEVSDIAE